MAIAITLKEYLDDHDIDYEVIDHRRTDSVFKTCEAVHIPADQMAKSVLLGDDDSYLMAVIPASHRVHMDRLSEITARRLELIEEIELVEAFTDCEPGAIPPLGRAYGIETLVAPQLLQQSDVYFESGDHIKVLHLSGEQFQSLADETAAQSKSRYI